MIHIYFGNGKGKTTAAVGLAVRMAGAGRRVVFSQFFKDGTSSEIGILRGLEHVTVMHCKTVGGWYAQMSEAEKQQAARDYGAFFRQVTGMAAGADLLVLDEVLFASRCGAVEKQAVLRFLREAPESLEVVLTGREPEPELLEMADYVTRMEKVKHPFEQGMTARCGVEY